MTEDDIAKIAATYHAWRGEEDAGEYADTPGFCKAATLKEIEAHGHVLTPGRFVGAEEIEDDGVPFEEKMAELSAALYAQMTEDEELDAAIRQNLEVLEYGEGRDGNTEAQRAQSKTSVQKLRDLRGSAFESHLVQS